MAKVATLGKLRRTQEERSASTRARLLDATIECLVELGYARITTTEIAERAGLSRGAQLHHFPTKAELVTTAVEHLFVKRDQEFRRAFAELPQGVNPADAAIDLLWSMISGPTFYAWLELAVAARTDPELKKKLCDIGRRFTENAQRTFHDLFPAPQTPNPFFDPAPAFTFALLEGLAVEKMTGGDHVPHAQVLGLLKSLAGLAFATGAG